MNLIYWGGWVFARMVGRLICGLKLKGTENIPKKGPFIIAVNHQSYFDPPLIGSMVGRELHFFAKSELFEVFFLGSLIRKTNAIPVRRGTFDPHALSAVDKVLSSNGALMIFPEGTRGDGVNLLPPKPGIGLIAKRSGVKIIPAYAVGLNRLGEAILRRQKAAVYFGPSIPVEKIDQFPDNKEGYRALADHVMDRIGNLRSEVESG